MKCVSYSLLFSSLCISFLSMQGLCLSPEVQELCDEYWNWRLSNMPEYATFVGIHDYDADLDDMSEAAYEARYTKCQQFLAQANELEPTLTDDADIVNIEVLKYELETYINFYHLKGIYLTINFLEGPQLDIEKQFNWMLRNTTYDYDLMISRLQKISLQLDQVIDLMRAGVANNVTYHERSMRNMDSAIGRFVVDDPRDSPLYVYFNDSFPPSFTQEEIQLLQEEAVAAISEYVTPAYEKLLNFILNEYVTRDQIAVTTIKNGKEFYDSVIHVVADPSPDAAGAYYLGGSFDGSRPGVFYVSTSNPGDQPKYSMLTLSLHEGDPGHHLQGAHCIESPDFPYFRRVTEDRNYGLSPSRFPLYTYYAEGWALYSEGLGFDMNLYGDPLERYGHYSEEIFRACRLVVDTGMHALGWSREQAIQYMLQNTASTRGEIEIEVDRYITWPGQALAYKIGQLKISELRSKSEEELGDLFDIKDFHEVILDSFGSLDIVESEVDKWINETLSNNI
ncbi:PHD finger-like domain-containing protein 5A [Armadillidium vulgare]|nr:PHD finger-like domain-containing protein 5A [Armadillidium vulgare]